MRAWFRIHLSTAILMMLAASFCLMMNLYFSIQLAEKNESVLYTSDTGLKLGTQETIQIKEFGFPFIFGHTRFSSTKLPAKMNIGSKAAPKSGPATVEYKRASPPLSGTTISARPLIGNVLIALIFIGAIAWISESLIRRRKTTDQ